MATQRDGARTACRNGRDGPAFIPIFVLTFILNPVATFIPRNDFHPPAQVKRVATEGFGLVTGWQSPGSQVTKR